MKNVVNASALIKINEPRFTSRLFESLEKRVADASSPAIRRGNVSLFKECQSSWLHPRGRSSVRAGATVSVKHWLLELAETAASSDVSSRSGVSEPDISEIGNGRDVEKGVKRASEREESESADSEDGES